MDRVQRRAAVHPGVQVALAGPHRRRRTPTRPRVASSIVGTSTPQHPAVEDHAGVGAALVLRDVVDDRVAADLLLAVEREAEVDRQRARLDEPLRRLEEEPELALVVGDAAPVRPLAADRRARTGRTPTARAARAAGRRSGCRRGRSARCRGRSRRGSRRARARAPPNGVSSAVPPMRRMSSQTHSPARFTSSRWAGSALTLGIAISSASSARQASSTGRDSTEIVRAAAERTRLVVRIEQRAGAERQTAAADARRQPRRGSPRASRCARRARAASCARAAPSRASSASCRRGASRGRPGSARAGCRPPCPPAEARRAAA